MRIESLTNAIFFDPVIHFWESVLGKSSEMWIKIYILEFSMECSYNDQNKKRKKWKQPKQQKTNK